MEMRVLELFAGIGGFSVGLERAGGFKPVAFCEIDKHARKVLQKNWPGVTIYEDVKEVTYGRLKADGNVPDVITGGFPCQDISTAGRGAGLAGERSGLWFEFARIIKEVRPRWVIAENVSALRSRGLDQVLRSLAEIGYDAEWHCIPASAVGAPHRRDRIWIVAYPNSTQCEGGSLPGRILEKDTDLGSGSWWEVEPPVGRVADGFPGRTHRLKQLGNAVVPQIPEIIGKAILEKINAEQ
jgi:DNA (cytosine-5)-methyltransferase 1